MTILKLSTAALVAASLFVATGAMAATPAKPVKPTHVAKPGVSFVMGKPTDAAALPDVTGWMLKFDPAALKAFDGAKTVSVFNYRTAWTGADAMKAAGLLKTDKKNIDALRAAIAKDAKAESLLKANHIKASQVVGVFDIKNAVSLYIL